MRRIEKRSYKLTQWCLIVFGAVGLASLWTLLGPVSAADASPAGPDPAVEKAKAPTKEALAKEAPTDEAANKLPSLETKVKGFDKLEGMFTLYRKKEKVFAAIAPGQLEKEYLLPIAIARGLASAGTPLNFGDEWVMSFKRVDDKVQVIRRNIHFEAPKGSSLARAVKQNYTDSILMAVPIVAENPGNQTVLIDLSDVLFGDFAQLRIGTPDRSRTSWHEVKAFSKNLELEVEYTYSTSPFGGFYYGYSDPSVVDSRGMTVVLHYSLMERPADGYKPRFADQRIGHFLNATIDFGSKDPMTTFQRRINRWRLEKADPNAKLSAPKKQLVWWVENTVPHEYRPYVEAGILEWNKAFERIGYRNAIGVRWQNENDKFDAEDTRYCTFRWVTTPYTYAMSGLRSDPITGEMIDGDVIFDASWIRMWKNEYAMLVGEPIRQGSGRSISRQPIEIHAYGEVISPMLAAKRGYGMPLSSRGVPSIQQDRGSQHSLVAVPGNSSPLRIALARRLTSCGINGCQCALAKRQEYGLAALAFAARRGDSEDGDNKDDGKDEDDQEDEDEDEDDQDRGDTDDDTSLDLPDEFIGNAIKEVVMHEVGHSLGLRHNFKASAMLSLEDINNEEITSQRGMTGSVMDYNPLNISRKGKPQGAYVMTTIGPYDYWAIEYAYSDVKGDESKALAKIASRSPEADLLYATDEDLYSSNDPLVNTYDLGNDPLAYASDRVALAKELLTDLDEHAVKEGQSWARLRTAFSVLLGQYGNAAYLASSMIGGEYVSRDVKGDGDERDPLVPVPGEQQRAALRFLVDNVLSDEPYRFRPQILRRLETEHWYHWGSRQFMTPTGMNIYDRVLSIQKIALNHCLSPDVLSRLQNQSLLVDDEAKPLGIDEVFRAITDGIWSPLKGKDAKISVMCRNLQRAHVRKLCRIVLGSSSTRYDTFFPYLDFMQGNSYSPDARSLARMHLEEIAKQIGKAKSNGDLVKAHFDDIERLIGKVLDANIETEL